MPAITLPDGSVRHFDGAVTGTTVAEAIGPGLARAALAMKLDGTLVDLATLIEHDARVQFVTRRDEAALGMIRHDAAHVLAEAVQDLYPGHAGHHRPVDRGRLLLRFRPQRAVHAGGFPGDRGQDAGDHRAQRPLRPLGHRPRRRHRVLQGARREIQGRADRGPAGKRNHHPLFAGRLDRPVPRPAHARHRRCRPRFQADEGGRRLLARRSPQRDAEPHLRHRLARPEGAGRLPAPAGGSRAARPSPHRQGNGSVPPPGRSRGQHLLASEGLEAVPHHRGLHAPPARCQRLSGSPHPATGGPRAVGSLRPLGEVPRAHVHRPGSGRGESPRAEADELPVPCADLQPGHPQLPRVAAAPGRVRLLPPLRAVGRAARHHARARSSPRTTRISSAPRRRSHPRPCASWNCSPASTAISASRNSV